MDQKNVVKINKTSNLSSKKPPKRLRKKLKNFFFSLFIFLVVLIIFYFASPISQLSVIYFNQLNHISRSTLIELTGLTENERFITINLQEIEEKLKSHSLVEQASVMRKGINSLEIQVTEKQIMGCVDIEGEFMYVLNDGQTISESNEVNILCQGIMISGLTQTELDESILSLFVSSLANVNPFFFSLIEAIEYEPKFGDVNRFSLFLKDGNTVIVNSYTMVDRLDLYQEYVEWISIKRGEGVNGTFNLDVGLFFEPYIPSNINDREELDEGLEQDLGEGLEQEQDLGEGLE